MTKKEIHIRLSSLLLSLFIACLAITNASAVQADLIQRSYEKYNAGDTVKAEIVFNNITINGSEAQIGAFNYDLNFDKDSLEYISTQSNITHQFNLVNAKNKDTGSIYIGYVYDPESIEKTEPHYYALFRVKKSIDTLDIVGKCKSLTAISLDGKDKKNLLTPNSVTDDYSSLAFSVVTEEHILTPDVPLTPDKPVNPENPLTPDKPTVTYKIGDVDDDGKISAKDSMLVQRYVINLKKLDDKQLKAADVNEDNKISNKDAIDILRYSINLSKNKNIGLTVEY